MFIVGIDIAQHTHQASVMNPDGSLIGKSIKISNTSSGYEAFIEKLQPVEKVTRVGGFFDRLSREITFSRLDLYV